MMNSTTMISKKESRLNKEILVNQTTINSKFVKRFRNKLCIGLRFLVCTFYTKWNSGVSNCEKPLAEIFPVLSVLIDQQLYLPHLTNHRSRPGLGLAGGMLKYSFVDGHSVRSRWYCYANPLCSSFKLKTVKWRIILKWLTQIHSCRVVHFRSKSSFFNQSASLKAVEQCMP